MRAGSKEVRVAGWIDFAICMAVNYYQLITMIESDQKVLNLSGWATNILVFETCCVLEVFFGEAS